MPWKSSGGWLKVLGSCTHVGHGENVPDFRLWIGSVAVFAVTWGVLLQYSLKYLLSSSLQKNCADSAVLETQFS